MAMSALLGLAALASRNMSTYGRTWADIIVAISLLAVLIPRYGLRESNPRHPRKASNTY